MAADRTVVAQMPLFSEFTPPEVEELVEGSRRRIVLRDTRKLFALAEGIAPCRHEND